MNTGADVLSTPVFLIRGNDMLLNAVIWLLAGAFNFYRAATVRENGTSVFMAILFTVVGIIWLIRYIRQKREDKNG